MKKNNFLYCVITHVGKECLCDELEPNGSRKFAKRHPFGVGELLVLDAEMEREIGFPGRSPRKWGWEIGFLKKLNLKKLNPILISNEITYRYFKDLNKAAHFSQIVQGRINDQP